MKRTAAVILLLLAMQVACPSSAAPSRVLVVYDSLEGFESRPHWALPALRTILGHFDTAVTQVPAEDYREGEVEHHNATIYLGLRPGAPLPERLLADIYDTDRTVCWLGHNIEQLASRFSLGRYGFRVEQTEAVTGHESVSYRGHLLKRGPAPLNRITVAQPAVCETLAIARGGEATAPYAVRSGRFWYFPDVPLLAMDEAGHYLVLCDQLHEILNQTHPTGGAALLCIEAVGPDSDPGSLQALIEYLQGQRIPFAISVAPIVSDPWRNLEMRLSSRAALANILRTAQRQGAGIIAHGPVQRIRGQTPEGTERMQPSQDRPGVTSSQIDQTVAELASCGLFPLAWSAADGDASPQACAEAAQRWSTVRERRRPGPDAPAPQLLPYLIRRDVYEEQVIPDNLTPLGEAAALVESILMQAQVLTAVSDPWAGITISPDTPPSSLRALLAGFRDMGYRFADLRHMDNRLRGRSLRICSTDVSRQLTDVLADGWDGIMLGPEARDVKRFDRPGRDHRESEVIQPGAILVAYPRGVSPHRLFTLDAPVHGSARRFVELIARAALAFAVFASVLLAIIYLMQVSLQRRP